MILSKEVSNLSQHKCITVVVGDLRRSKRKKCVVVGDMNHNMFFFL